MLDLTNGAIYQKAEDLINEEAIACVHTLMAEDNRFTILDIHKEMVEYYLAQTSHRTVFRILTEEL